MNKKEISRYTLGIIEGVETRTIKNQYELGTLYEKIQKYNSNPKNPYFLGKIRIFGNGIIEFKKYRKITEPSTLEKIDMLTTMYKNDYDLKKVYSINTKTPHKLEVLYRFNKDIRTLPVIYKESKSYIDRNFLKQYINNIFIVTPELLSSILDNDQIQYACRTNIEEYESLFALREQLLYNANADITRFSKFYSSFITQGGKFNYFNFRLLGVEFMNQDNQKFKQEETPEQLIMSELEKLNAREDYEDAKLKLTEY